MNADDMKTCPVCANVHPKGFDCPERVDIESPIAQIQARYGFSRDHAKLVYERERVYGDSKVNHKGIAGGWAALLQPHAERIARGEPLPPHVVALMMVSFKVTRMRNVYHEDNYEDASAYMAFARTWQREHDAELRDHPPTQP